MCGNCRLNALQAPFDSWLPFRLSRDKSIGRQATEPCAAVDTGYALSLSEMGAGASFLSREALSQTEFHVMCM